MAPASSAKAASCNPINEDSKDRFESIERKDRGTIFIFWKVYYRLLQHAVIESEPGKYQWRYDENRRSLGKLFTWRDLGAFGSFAGAIMIG